MTPFLRTSFLIITSAEQPRHCTSEDLPHTCGVSSLSAGLIVVRIDAAVDRLRAAIFSFDTADRFFPVFAALIFARVSAENILPYAASLNLTIVTSECCRPICPRPMLALAISVWTRPVCAALILPRVSGDKLFPRFALRIFSLDASEWRNPLTPSPPSVLLVKQPVSKSLLPKWSIRNISKASAISSLRSWYNISTKMRPPVFDACRIVLSLWELDLSDHSRKCAVGLRSGPFPM